MKPRKLIPLLLTPLLAACAVQEPAGRDTIPRQLAEDLASGQIYLELPEGFPAFNMPEDLEVEGGLDRGSSLTVVLKSELSTDVMEETIRAELARSGWSELETRTMQQRGGFVGNVTPMQARLLRSQLCHDRYGMISIGPRSRQGIYNRVGMDWNYSVNNARITCAQQNEQRQDAPAHFNPMGGLSEQMPILELPEEDRGTRFRPYASIGVSGNSSSASTRSFLTLDWSLDEINRWFAEQLEDQDWELDVSWIGESTAGSTWSKLIDDDSELAGLLDIIRTEEMNFELHFRLTRKGQ